MFVTTVCCIIYLYLPTAVKQAFALFNCYEVGGEPFLLADLEEPCYEGRHSMFLMLVGLPQLALFVVGMPGLGFYFLTRNRARLSEFVPKARYSLFYAGYRDERYFWELVVVVRKVAVIAISVFCNGIDPELQALLVMLFILLLLGAEFVGKPFRKSITTKEGHVQSLNILRWLELLMMFMLLLTLWGGLMLFKLKQSAVKEFLTVTIVLLNVVFLSYLLYTLVSQCCQEKREEDSALVKKADALRKSMSKRVWGRLGSVLSSSRGGSDTSKLSDDDEEEKEDTTAKDFTENPMEQNTVVEMVPLDSSTTGAHRRNSTKLPQGWTKHNDDAGRRYYCETAEQSASWTAPVGATGGSTGIRRASATPGEIRLALEMDVVPVHRRRSTKLPEGWTKHNDDAGRRYYFDTAEQSASWTAPEGATGGSASLQ